VIRRHARLLKIGSLPIGGGAPISVQTMATADPHDVAALSAQVMCCAEAGADIVRLAIPDAAAAETFATVRSTSPIPLVADVHFDHRLALASIAAGCDALRINPGNIGGRANVQAVARAALERRVPIRIGVNGGSLEKDILEKHGSATAEALVESAMRHVKLLEDEGFRDIVISVKASDVLRTLAAYRMLAELTEYPLHLGVTEAGTFLPGTVRSSVALGILLGEGIGDTIRVSLTDAPEREVQVGLEILRALGLRACGPSVTSCPMCGRTQVDVAHVAAEVETALERYARTVGSSVRMPHVAIMGCAVNGPGEAREADIALCGGKDEFVLYVRGKVAGNVSAENAVDAVVGQVKSWMASGGNGEENVR